MKNRDYIVEKINTLQHRINIMEQEGEIAPVPKAEIVDEIHDIKLFIINNL